MALNYCQYLLMANVVRDTDPDEHGQVKIRMFPSTWGERFLAAWRVFAYPSRYHLSGVMHIDEWNEVLRNASNDHGDDQAR